MIYLNIDIDENFFSHTIVTLTIIWISLNMTNLTMNNFKRLFNNSLEAYNKMCEINGMK